MMKLIRSVGSSRQEPSESVQMIHIKIVLLDKTFNFPYRKYMFCKIQKKKFFYIILFSDVDHTTLVKSFILYPSIWRNSPGLLDNHQHGTIQEIVPLYNHCQTNEFYHPE